MDLSHHAWLLSAASGQSVQYWRDALARILRASSLNDEPEWQRVCALSPVTRGAVLRERGIRAVIVASESLPPGAATLCHSDACRLARFHSGQCETAGASGECAP